MKKNIVRKGKVILFLICVCIFFLKLLIEMKTPNVAMLKENKLLSRIEKPTGYIYYNDTTKNVEARFGVYVINKDSKPHKVAFNIDSKEYKEYSFINSDFTILKIYRGYGIIDNMDYTIGNEIIIEGNKTEYIRFCAIAEYGGVKDHRRAGPPVELKILE